MADDRYGTPDDELEIERIRLDKLAETVEKTFNETDLATLERCFQTKTHILKAVRREKDPSKRTLDSRTLRAQCVHMSRLGTNTTQSD